MTDQSTNQPLSTTNYFYVKEATQEILYSSNALSDKKLKFLGSSDHPRAKSAAASFIQQSDNAIDGYSIRKV